MTETEGLTPVIKQTSYDPAAAAPMPVVIVEAGLFVEFACRYLS
jgi:hypothetical protein